MTTTLDIKTIRPKAYAVLRKAGQEIAKASPSRIRGMKSWSHGVTLVERFGAVGRGVYVVHHLHSMGVAHRNNCY